MIRIFISYSHTDARWFREDEPFGIIPWLAASLRDVAVFWFDRSGLLAGDDFRQRIEHEIAQADIALLLVSQAFLNSEFIRTVELPRIIERAAGGLTVIPLLLEPCFWEENAFLSSRHMIPGQPTPLITYCTSENAFIPIRFDILRAIKGQVMRLAAPAAPPAAPAPGHDMQAAAPAPGPGTQAAAPGGYLPSPVTAFVGREDDMRNLGELLQDPLTRMVTIIGLGGIGKTRLAIETARRRSALFPDGAWFVDLRGISTGGEISLLMAQTLHITPSGDRPVLDQVLDRLANRRCLLIFDNCEHIADAAQVIGHILRQAPQVTALATSRSPLLITGEQLYELKPFPVPAAGTFDLLMQCDSVQLFAQHARQNRRGWELTRDNAAVVYEICRRLEGIPLCIVLATAHLRYRTLQEIRAGLDDRLGLLTSSSQDLPDNQRALRKMIDWSYHLLRSEEQALFTRLALFPGGCAAGAVETVLQVRPAHDALGALCDASLLEQEIRQERTRFRWMESIREYAEEKLRAIDPAELAGLHERHAQYYLEMARRQAACLRTAEEAQAIAEFSLELPNLRLAFAWASGQHAACCAQLATVLIELLSRRGDGEDEALCQTGVRAARQCGDRESEGLALLCLASTLQDRGALDAASEQAGAALALFRQLADRRGEARALNLLAIISADRGDYVAAFDRLAQALPICREEHDRIQEGVILHNLGLMAQHQGDRPAALDYYQQALAIRRELGDQRGIAETRINTGVMAQDQGNLREAARLYHECLDASLMLDNHLSTALALHNLGEVAAECCRLDYALPLLTTAAHLLHRLGSPIAAASETYTGALRAGCDPAQFDEHLHRAQSLSYDQVLALAQEVEGLVDTGE